MRKPKLTIGQLCYFPMFSTDLKTGISNFKVYSGRVKGIEYESETDSIVYVLDVHFEVTWTPDWFRKIFPEKFRILKPLYHLYHRFHKDFNYYVDEVEVFHDFRDAIANANDCLQLKRDLEAEWRD